MASKVTVIILVGVMVMVGAFATMAFDISGWNTTGETGSKKGYDFKVELTQTKYATSWKSGADSEAITAQPYALRVDFWTAANLVSHRFAWYVEGNLVQHSPTSGWYADTNIGAFDRGEWKGLESATIKVKGEIVGRLTCRLEVKMSDVWPASGFEGEIAWDGAYLASGVGSIAIKSDSASVIPVFEKGETVEIIVNTGFSSGRGWSVKGYAPADRTDITMPAEVSLGDDVKNKVISIPTGDNWYSPTSTNEYQWVLTNNLFEAGFTSSFHIDEKIKSPVISDISETNNGDSFTYTVKVNKTFAPLSHIVVKAYYSYGNAQTQPSVTDTESWIIYNGQFPIDSSGTAFFTVVPKNLGGTVVCMAIAYDTENRPSQQYLRQFIVTDEGKTEPGGPIDQPLIWSNFAIAVLVTGLVASVAVGAKYILSGKMDVGLMVIAAGSAISGFFAYFIAATPSLATMMGWIIRIAEAML